jgi:hypothetical protein
LRAKAAWIHPYWYLYLGFESRRQAMQAPGKVASAGKTRIRSTLPNGRSAVADWLEDWLAPDGLERFFVREE